MLTIRRSILASFSLLALAAAGRGLPAIAQTASPATGSSEAITEQEAQAIGVDAYIYFYPLVTMDMTRKQLTNVEPGKESARRR